MLLIYHIFIHSNLYIRTYKYIGLYEEGTVLYTYGIAQIWWGKLEIPYSTERNCVVRQSKMLRSKYYRTQLENLKKTDSRSWWRNVKSLIGLTKQDSTEAMQLLANKTSNGSIQNLAESANSFFASITDGIKPLPAIRRPGQPNIHVHSRYIISTEDVERALANTKLGKSSGPDGIQPWMLRDFAYFLANPISAIFNSSIRDGFVPEAWKTAFITPIAKVKQPKLIEEDLRPISLTSILSKTLEKFVITWIREEVNHKLDKSQYGNVKKCSTTHLLIKLLHEINTALDTGNQSVRAVFIDFSKAFDRVNHGTLLEKLKSLGLSQTLLDWTYSFLEGRTQCVKIGNSKSEWKKVNGAVPQGTLFGMEGFIVHINDLQLLTETLKYVDDATAYEILPTSDLQSSKMQDNMQMLETWTTSNEMMINTKKTKEMFFSASKVKQPPTLTLDGAEIARVKSIKLVGVEITENLTWNDHVASIVKKNHSKLYYLKLLKRAGVNTKDLITFYTTIIRSSIEYAAPVWGTGLPVYLMDSLENLQKRAISTIFPNQDYAITLKSIRLPHLSERIDTICRNFFTKIQTNDDRIHHLLPEEQTNSHNTRQKKKYLLPQLRTERAKRSFINHSLFHYQ